MTTRALITNGDGIDAPGLHQLARTAKAAGLEIVVAAPAEEASGSSAAITGTHTIAVTGDTDASTIRIETREPPGLDGVPAYSVSAAPGLITLFAAHGAFGPLPDFVLSGINRGAHLGRVVLHSGTAGEVLERVLPMLRASEPGTVLNLNVPNVASGSSLEIREASLAPFGIVQTTMTETVGDDLRLTVRELPEHPIAGSDAALLFAGHATLTRIVAVRAAERRMM